MLQFIASSLFFLTYSLSLIWGGVPAWAGIEVAITVDDLPISSATLSSPDEALEVSNKMIAAFRKHGVNGVYGFLNAKPLSSEKKLERILENWKSAGHFLGNHTYSHADIDRLSVAEYSEEIKKNEPALQAFMGKNNFRYFRYPYLAEGETREKREGIRKFLFDSHYSIAPVSMDFFDYEWNVPYLRCKQKGDQASLAWLKKSYVQQAISAIEVAHLLSMDLFKRDIKYILLIHIGPLQAEVLDSLLSAFEAKGVKFVSLPESLSDEAYQINPNIVAKRAYTFLNQIRISRGLPNPKRVSELYSTLPEDKLNSICR